jgi:hypothetical protein
MRELPQVGDKPPGGRADAIRNRRQLLSAAAEFVTQVGGEGHYGWSGLLLGPGKGHRVRHFGSRAGISRALLDEEERGLQSAVISGEPPLGPGAQPQDRLVADGHARVRLHSLALVFGKRPRVLTQMAPGGFWAF